MRNPFSFLFKKVKEKSYWVGITSVLGNLFDSQNSTSRDYLDAYEASFLVHACVRKIAEKVANTYFRLYQVRGKKVSELQDHPLLDLLAQVNPTMTQFEFLDVLETCLQTTGNAYVYKNRGDKSKKPLELWLLRPDWVTVKMGDKNLVEKYDYRTENGTLQTFDAKDIVHFKKPNPKSSIYGLSPIKPALEIIKSLIFANRWNMNFFYNSARPDFVLTSKTALNAEDKIEFERKWKEKFAGIDGAHKFAILSGAEDIKITELTTTAKDMDFANLTSEMVNQILAAFGVPKSIIGMVGMNRAEAEAQIFTFLSETVEPEVRRINDRLNEFLVPEFGDNLYLDYDDPVPQNREAVLLEYSNALTNHWMVINEVRDEEGMPPLDGGWDFYLPFSDAPAGGVPANEQKGIIKIKGLNPKKYFEQKEKNKNEKLLRKVLAGKRKLKLEIKLKGALLDIFKEDFKKKPNKIKKIKFNAEQRAGWWNEHVKLLDKDEKIFKMMTGKLFESQKERALKNVDDSVGKGLFQKDEWDLLDWEEENDVFAEVSLPVYEDLVKKRGSRAAALLGAKFDIDEKVRKFIDDKRFKFAEEVNKTTAEKLKKTLKEGVENGESVADLKRRVGQVFEDRAGYENERIARTEVISASNGAEMEAYKQSGVVEKKEWIATMDDRTREEHSLMDGEVVDLDEPFSNGLDYPGDPSGDAEDIINCRCTEGPVVE